MIVHTAECVENRERYERRAAQWRARWPNHCPACHGAGEITRVEDAPAGGEAYWPVAVTDVCDECLGQGRCPRCGVAHGERWAVPAGEGAPTACPACGWDWGTRPDDVCPEPYECCCGVAAEIQRRYEANLARDTADATGIFTADLEAGLPGLGTYLNGPGL